MENINFDKVKKRITDMLVSLRTRCTRGTP